jgi:hypothetical protein
VTYEDFLEEIGAGFEYRKNGGMIFFCTTPKGRYSARSTDHLVATLIPVQGKRPLKRTGACVRIVERCIRMRTKAVVPRDRIELSTPGFSAARTDVRRRPQRSIIVFTEPLKARLTCAI